MKHSSGIAALALCSSALIVPGGSARTQGNCPGTVDVARSTIPCVLNLVGTAGGVADPMGEYVVRLINTQGRAMADVLVDIVVSDDYHDPYADYRISTNQPFPGMTTTCYGLGHHIFSAVTDDLGYARFRIVGASVNPTCADAGNDWSQAHVFACGQELGGCNSGPPFYTNGITVGTPDLDGGSGINAADLSAWLGDWACGTYHARSDFDGDHAVGSADLSILTGFLFGGGSVQSAAGPFCP